MRSGGEGAALNSAGAVRGCARRRLAVALLSLLAGCTGLPEGVEPVAGFDLSRYLGTWFEVARLDHSFERGLTQVTATYRLREDGGVRVLNRGFDAAAGEWQESVGKAYFVDAPDVGRLKVSFFGPFYGGYNVIALDEDYQHAVVAGPNRSFLWILSRTRELPPATLEGLVAMARNLGFPTEALIFVAQSNERPSG